MQLPNVEKLDSEDKNWFARAIAGMVVADGRVDESETAFLKEALGFLEDRSQVEQIMGIVKQGKPPEMPAAKIDSKQAFIMLKYLSELMVADAHLSPGEVRFFLYSGRLLGFTPDILTKLWKTARAQLEATLPKAVAQIGNQTVEITLTELHDSKFSFRFGQALTPNCKIILKLHRSDGSFCDPIACRMAGQHQDKFDQGSFTILGRFEQKVAEPHGILQILHPDQFTGHDENILKPNKDSLMGRLVHCFLCNEPRVPHYVLRSRSMITAPNIFGVPAYEKPAGNLQFCDYNLIQITTCPKCGFSANDLSFFKKHPEVEVELRTKSVNIETLLGLKPLSNCVVAFSLSPAKVADALDKKAPRINKRIRALQKLAKSGWLVGLRLDPLIYCDNWKGLYSELIKEIMTDLEIMNLHSVSFGPLRYPKKMYKTIEALYPEEKLFAFPLQTTGTLVSYGPEIENEMANYIQDELKKYLGVDKIFQCLI